MLILHNRGLASSSCCQRQQIVQLGLGMLVAFFWNSLTERGLEEGLREPVWFSWVFQFGGWQVLAKIRDKGLEVTNPSDEQI